MTNTTTITPGTKVFAICGPGEFAADGMCDMTGVVLGSTTDQFGTWFDVMWDNGHMESVKNIHPHDKPGIGVKTANPNF